MNITEAAVLASDGDFSMADMTLVFSDMARKIGYNTHDPVKIWEEVGFTDENKQVLFNKLKNNVEKVFKDYLQFYSFFSPINGHTPSDGESHHGKCNDGKRRAYTGKNEIAMHFLGDMGQALGIVDDPRHKSRLAARDEKFDDLIKFLPSGQLVLSNVPGTWNKAPLDMVYDLLGAARNNSAIKSKIFHYFADDLHLNFAKFGDDEKKVEDEFENCILDLFQKAAQVRFPNAMAEMNDNFLDFNNVADANTKKQVDKYTHHYNQLMADFDKLKSSAIEQQKFFVELDRTTSLAAVFGGVKRDLSEVRGVPDGLRTFDILKDIVDGKEFKADDKAGIRANALLRIIDATYARDPYLQKEALAFLSATGTTGENRGTELVNEINKQILDNNKIAKPEDVVETIDPYKQPGFVWNDETTRDRIIFNPDDPLLKINASLVNMAPTQATVAIWQKAELAHWEHDVATLDKLQDYVPCYKVQVRAVEQTSEKRYSDLNTTVLADLENLENWQNLPDQIDAKIAEAKNLSNSDREFLGFVQKIEDFMTTYKPQMTDNLGIITLSNISNLMNDFVLDKQGVLAGAGYGFSLGYYEETLGQIENQQAIGGAPAASEPELLFLHTEPNTDQMKRLMQMSDEDSTYEALQAIRTVESKREEMIQAGMPLPCIVLDDPICKEFRGVSFAKLKSTELTQHNTVLNMTFVDRRGHEHAVFTNGKTTNVSCNGYNEFPPFEVWKNIAAMQKELGSTVVDVNCSDQYTSYVIAMALASEGIEANCTKVSLSKEQAEAVLKVRQAALRQGEPNRGTNENLRGQALKTLDSESREIERVLDSSLVHADAGDEFAKLNASDDRIRAKLDNLRDMPISKRLELCTDLQPVIKTNFSSGVIGDLYDNAANKNLSADDLLVLAKAMVIKDQGSDKLYTSSDAGQAVVDKYAADPHYEDQKKAEIRSDIARDWSGTPLTEGAMNGAVDTHPVGAVTAAIYETKQKLEIHPIPSDMVLKNQFEASLQRQSFITAAEQDYASRSSVKPEEKKVFQYMFQLWRMSPETLVKLIEKEAEHRNLVGNIKDSTGKQLMTMAKKIEAGNETLTWEEVQKAAVIVDNSWSSKADSPAKAFVNKQNEMRRQVKEAYKDFQQYAKGTFDDENSKDLAKYIYLVASNEVLSNPIDVKRILTDDINVKANDKLADLARSVPALSGKTMEDLKTFTLTDADFNACKAAIGMDTREKVKAAEEAFNRYVKPEKVR